jgi:hypothetical protein
VRRNGISDDVGVSPWHRWSVVTTVLVDASAIGAEVLAAFGEDQALTILRVLELPDDARVTASSVLVGSMGELEICQFLAAVEAEPTGAARLGSSWSSTRRGFPV